MVVCEVFPQKEDPQRTCIIIAGNHIYYPGDFGTPTGSLELVKMIINSVLSCPGAGFGCYDAKTFYMQTPMERPEYFRLKLTDIPQEFIDEYDLTQSAHNGCI